MTCVQVEDNAGICCNADNIHLLTLLALSVQLLSGHVINPASSGPILLSELDVLVMRKKQ